LLCTAPYIGALLLTSIDPALLAVSPACRSLQALLSGFRTFLPAHALCDVRHHSLHALITGRLQRPTDRPHRCLHLQGMFLENTTSRACSQGRLPELLLLSRRAFLSGGCLYRLLQATSQDRPLQPTDLVTIASNRRLFFFEGLPVGLARFSDQHRSDVAKLRR